MMQSIKKHNVTGKTIMEMEQDWYHNQLAISYICTKICFTYLCSFSMSTKHISFFSTTYTRQKIVEDNAAMWTIWTANKDKWWDTFQCSGSNKQRCSQWHWRGILTLLGLCIRKINILCQYCTVLYIHW